jgi:hypothetical protein
MTIIEKHYQSISLNPKEKAQEKVLFLELFSDLKLLFNSLPEMKKEQFNKIMSLLLLYYPEDWKRTLLNSFSPEVLERLVKEETEKGL